MKRRRWVPYLVVLVVTLAWSGVVLATTVIEGSMRPPALSVESVTVDAAPAEAFARYAATTERGWTGGDSTYSVRLPDGRIVWLFSDTFLGPLNPNGTRPTKAAMVNNTFVVQDGDRLSTVLGGTADRPAALMPPAGPGRWFWTGDGQVSGAQLQVVFREYRRTGAGAWSFVFDRSVVATFSLADLSAPTSVDPLPSGSGVAWGAALLPVDRSGDGYTYMYGVVTTPAGKAMRVARVPGGDLRQGSWQYRAGNGWTDDEHAATDVLTGVADEFSVTPWGGRLLLVSADAMGLGHRINGWTAAAPQGPFSGKTVLYRMPEAGPRGSYHDRDVIAYNAHAHAALSTGDTLLVSYNVTSLDGAIRPGADHYRDPGIYRPRFVEVHLRAPR